MSRTGLNNERPGQAYDRRPSSATPSSKSPADMSLPPSEESLSNSPDKEILDGSDDEGAARRPAEGDAPVVSWPVRHSPRRPFGRFVAKEKFVATFDA